MSRLRDIYGSDFAEQLWASYVENFEIGEESEKIVSPLTLKAIGQVSSSDRKDLSYGPRTAVSTFGQMVPRYQETNARYEVEDFVDGCLDDEILVSPDYPTRVRECLDQPEATMLNKSFLKILAGFPNGMSIEMAHELGIDESFLDQAKRSGVVYKLHGLCGLVALRKKEAEIIEKEPHQTIEEIFNEFAPSPKSFETSKEAFIKYVIPQVFERRSGHQLVGWELPDRWLERKNGVRFAEIIGAFKQTARDYPRRRIAVAIGPVSEIFSPEEFSDRETQTDLLIHFLLRWNVEETLPDKLVEILPGRPQKHEPTIIRLTIDLTSEPIPNDQLENIVDSNYLTPLGILYLIGEMDKRNFPTDIDAIWNSIRKLLLRALPVRFFQDEEIRSQASENIGKPIPGGAIELVPTLCTHVLKERFPEYSTLIKQPQWVTKVKSYISALQKENIPLSCRRSREVWKTSKDEAARAFGTNIMNLGDYFSGHENLININMGKSKDDPAVVEFKLHPLEKKIMDRITEEKPSGKLKIADKECWWVDFSELVSIFLYSGYQTDEIGHIVEMGKARGTFYATKHKGSPILYCMPLDPEQMKNQLRDKLQSLSEVIEELKKIPGYRHDFDFESTEKKIDALVDDADFESIKSKIHRTFEENHDRLDTYFNRLEDSLSSETSNAVQIEQGIATSRQVAGLKNPMAALSRWCADLNIYIVANLSETSEEINRECKYIKQKVNLSSAKYTSNRKGKPLEKIKRIQDGWNELTSLKVQVKDLKDKFQQLKRDLDDFDQWRRLLGTSDDLHKKLIEMKRDDAHKMKANELIQETDDVWDEISNLLSTRNISGLKNHKQYFKQLEEIENKRKRYLQELKGAFDLVKDRVNTFLKDAGLGADSRVNVVFNPDDSKGCYSQLYSQALQQLNRITKSESAELSEKRLELLYASNVLKRMPEDEVSPILSKLEQSEIAMKNIIENLTEDWIEEVAKVDGKPKPGVDEVKETISKTREASRKARNMILEKTKKKPETEISRQAKEMLKMIPQNQTVDLKQIILEMLKEEQPPAGILEPALEYLSELFRNDEIQIKLELPRSR